MNQEECLKTVSYLLEKIEARTTPANMIIADYMQTHRYLTPADREEIFTLVWRAIRSWFHIHFLYPDKDWPERIQTLTTGLPEDKALPDYVRWEVPEWLISHIPEADKELPALLEPAPVILRANGNRDKVMTALRDEGFPVHPCDKAPWGIVLKTHADITKTKVYKKGLLEIQDEGAQLAALDVGVQPGQDVFDFCAGAGGKSLIFAQMMNNRGFIQAYDIAPKKLFELTRRAERCHVSIVKIVTKLPEPFKKFHHVVVDAPCSGTGTWRRVPDMRWKLTEKQLGSIVAQQKEILDRAEQFVKPGQCLTYITCSLTLDENENQIADFLKRHPNYVVLQQKRYSPWRTNTDGFFMCQMRKG